MDADARLDAAIGSVAEEAARLLEALGRPRSVPGGSAEPAAAAAPGDTGETGGHTASGGGADGATAGEHVHVAMGDAETCTWCPVCRSVTLLRGVSPETLGRLADLATTAATVLADLATRHTEAADATAPGGPTTAERTPRTEPITVVDEEEAP